MNKNNNGQLGLGEKLGCFESKRSRAMSDDILRNTKTDNSERKRKRSASDSSLQLARRRIENEEEREGRNTRAKIAILPQLGICNMLECWKCIIHRYVQPGDSYQVVVSLGQVSKFWNNEVKAFLSGRIISHYKQDEVVQMDRFELLKNPGDEGFPLRWIQNILILYFAAVNRLKELEDQIGLEKLEDQISACQNYKTLFNQFFDKCIAAWVKEGFHFSVTYGRDWSQLNGNDSFNLQFSGQELSLRSKDRQQNYLLSRFFEKYLSNRNYLELIEKDGLLIVKIGEILCQNKASKSVNELLNDLSQVLFGYYKAKDWAVEKKVDWELQQNVLRLLSCFAKAGLHSIEDAESLLQSIVKMFHNLQATESRIECGIDCLVNLAMVDLISVEKILFNLTKIKSDESCFQEKYALGRMFNLKFTDKWLKDCYKEDFNNEVKKSAKLNKKKLKNCLVRWLHACDSDMQIFALKAPLHLYSSTSKGVLQVKHIVMDIVLRLLESPSISKEISKRLMDLTEINSSSYVDCKGPERLIELQVMAEFELTERIESLCKKLSRIMEDLQNEVEKRGTTEDDCKKPEETKIVEIAPTGYRKVKVTWMSIEDEEFEESSKSGGDYSEEHEDISIERTSSMDKTAANYHLEVFGNGEVKKGLAIEQKLLVKAQDLEEKRGAEIKETRSSNTYLMFALLSYFVFLVFFCDRDKV